MQDFPFKYPSLQLKCQLPIFPPKGRLPGQKDSHSLQKSTSIIKTRCIQCLTVDILTFDLEHSIASRGTRNTAPIFCLATTPKCKRRKSKVQENCLPFLPQPRKISYFFHNLTFLKMTFQRAKIMLISSLYSNVRPWTRSVSLAINKFVASKCIEFFQTKIFFQKVLKNLLNFMLTVCMYYQLKPFLLIFCNNLLWHYIYYGTITQPTESLPSLRLLVQAPCPA